MRQLRLQGKVVLWIAWRNLISRKKRGGLSFMTWISVAGVTVGVAALIIVLSVMGGFENDLKNKMLKGQPHLEILGQNARAGFSLQEHPIATIGASIPHVQGIEAFTQADVVLKQGKHLAAVELIGVAPEAKGHLWGFGDSMVEGRVSDIGALHAPLLTTADDTSRWPGIILGQALASQLGADLGDEITILSPSAATSASSALSGGTLTRHYVVSGLFQTGMAQFDSKWAVVSLAEGRKFMADYDPSLDEEEYVTGIALNVTNPYDAEKVAKKITETTGLEVKTWMQTNAALLFALKLEKFTMGSILMLIVLVASFSISGTTMMTVFHKKRQVCLLRSLGMTKGDIVTTFLAQGLTIGGVGVLSGLLVGLGACVFLDQIRYVNVPSNLMSLRSLPVKFLYSDYLVICGAALILSTLGAVYPALVAARQNPSSGLRY